MSIHCYVGMPGSGKSYNAVANQIVPALKEGRTVVTNIPLHLDKLRALYPTGKVVEFPLASVMQNPDTIKEYVTPGCVFVLDEVWRIWPMGEKANKIPEVYRSLLAEHRHMVAEVRNPQTGKVQKVSTQIVLIVQDAANMATFARKLIETTFIHTKMSHVGASGRFRVDMYHGPVTGTIGPVNNRIREVFGTYSNDVWDLYKSHTMSEASTDGASEVAVDKRANALLRPMFVILIPLMLVGAGFAIWKLNKDFHTQTAPKAVPLKGQIERPETVAVKRTAIGQEIYHPTAERPAPQFRVLGYIKSDEHPEKNVAVLTDGHKTLTRGLEHCRTVDTDFLECEVAGTYYSTLGGSVIGNQNAPVPFVASVASQANFPLSSVSDRTAGGVAARPSLDSDGAPVAAETAAEWGPPRPGQASINRR